MKEETIGGNVDVLHVLCTPKKDYIKKKKICMFYEAYVLYVTLSTFLINMNKLYAYPMVGIVPITDKYIQILVWYMERKRNNSTIVHPYGTVSTSSLM